jgi:hypothetical protein
LHSIIKCDSFIVALRKIIWAKIVQGQVAQPAPSHLSLGEIHKLQFVTFCKITKNMNFGVGGQSAGGTKENL